MTRPRKAARSLFVEKDSNTGEGPAAPEPSPHRGLRPCLACRRTFWSLDRRLYQHCPDCRKAQFRQARHVGEEEGQWGA